MYLAAGRSAAGKIEKEAVCVEINKKQTTGTVKISDQVLLTIVKSVLRDVEGVYSLMNRPVTAKGVFSKSYAFKPVEIRSEAGVAEIDISICLCYGYPVKKVADQIQRKVKGAVQDMTGIAVNKVNVFIGGVKQKVEA